VLRPHMTFGRDLGHNAAQIRQRGGFILAWKRDPGVRASPAPSERHSAPRSAALVRLSRQRRSQQFARAVARGQEFEVSVVFYRARGLVLLQVGTAFVTPTEGQEYEPTDGAVTVPTGVPDVP